MTTSCINAKVEEGYRHQDVPLTEDGAQVAGHAEAQFVEKIERKVVGSGYGGEPELTFGNQHKLC